MVEMWKVLNPGLKRSIEDVTETTRIQWVAFSHQFFSTILIADEYFDGAYMSQHRFNDPGKYVRQFSTTIDMPYNRTSDQTIGMQLYMGPNNFTALKDYGDLGLAECGNRGWSNDPVDQRLCGNSYF